jgi:hypothetical protein
LFRARQHARGRVQGLGSTGPGSITCGVRRWRRQATGSPRPTGQNAAVVEARSHPRRRRSRLSRRIPASPKDARVTSPSRRHRVASLKWCNCGDGS